MAADDRYFSLKNLILSLKNPDDISFVHDSDFYEIKSFTVKVTKPLVNNSVISSEAINLGNSVTINAKASGGSGKYTYGVYYKKSTSEKWVTVQSFSTKTTAMITPAAAVKYNICVKVKDSSGKVVDKVFDVTCTK